MKVKNYIKILKFWFSPGEIIYLFGDRKIPYKMEGI